MKHLSAAHVLMSISLTKTFIVFPEKFIFYDILFVKFSIFSKLTFTDTHSWDLTSGGKGKLGPGK